MNRLLTSPLVNRPLARAVRPLARFLSTDVLWRLPVVGTIEVQPEGWMGPPVLMATDGSDRVASMLYWRGSDGWEPATVRLFLRLAGCGSTALDIGAHSGLFSLLAARHHPQLRVHAVEPLARAVALLESNVALNRLTNVTCHRLACGAVSGRSQLHVPDEGAMTMMASLVAGWSDAAVTEEVECVTLDDLVEATAASDIGVIKLDAEGSEADVLGGAARTLDDHRPFILCEVLDRSGLGERITATLTERNYRFFTIGRDRLWSCQQITGAGDADEGHNYLFAPDSRLAELARVAGEW
ncbi:MAG: FkbM family methyltransferase [Actinomycetota bacterium]|nr:FkbM family methyltransferase [Actinomycetota bacterium]